MQPPQSRDPDRSGLLTDATGETRLTPFPPSLVGGPAAGVGGDPGHLHRRSIMSSSQETPARGVPAGSMETGDAGGLAPSWRGTEPPSCANGRRGQPPQPALQTRSAAVRAQRGGDCGRTARRGPAGGRGRTQEKRAPRALNPGPLPTSQPGAAETLGARGETSPGRQGTLRLPSCGPLPSLPASLGCFPRVAVGTGETTAAAALAASLIRALGNNFPPRARLPRKRR